MRDIACTADGSIVEIKKCVHKLKHCWNIGGVRRPEHVWIPNVLNVVLQIWKLGLSKPDR